METVVVDAPILVVVVVAGAVVVVVVVVDAGIVVVGAGVVVPAAVVVVAATVIVVVIVAVVVIGIVVVVVVVAGDVCGAVVPVTGGELPVEIALHVVDIKLSFFKLLLSAGSWNCHTSVISSGQPAAVATVIKSFPLKLMAQPGIVSL